MKLKKIASLALAGIMAVSMLAGCKDGGNSNSGSSSSEVTTVSGAAAAINAELDKNKDLISFSDDTSIENMMQVYFANHAITAPSWAGVTSNYMSDLESYIKTGLGAEWSGMTAVENMLKNNKATDSATGVVVYAVNAKMFTEASALKFIGQQIDMLELAEENASGTKNYEFSGTVSVVETKTKGGEESVLVFALTFTRDLADK